MAKKNYVVKLAGSYGKRGEVVELDLGKDGLTDRQKLMLEEYKKPVIKSDESELKTLKAKVKELEAELAELKKPKE